jgi:hypothetical protein
VGVEVGSPLVGGDVAARGAAMVLQLLRLLQLLLVVMRPRECSVAFSSSDSA